MSDNTPTARPKRSLKTHLLRLFCLTAMVILAFISAVRLYLAQPSLSRQERSTASVDPERLKTHVQKLSIDFHPRDFQHHDNLNRAADYIADHFRRAGAQVERQAVVNSDGHYVNVIGRFGVGNPRKLIVGAHYDAFWDATDDQATPGADDNASGVAGLIELAYLLGKTTLNREIELVAFTLEEPPFFLSDDMGSAVHAKSIATQKARLDGVIVLEMIGYFSDKLGSQTHPMPILKLVYPNRGNFVAVVGNARQRSFTKNVKIAMKGTTEMPIYSINAPEVVPGINFSDHASYWPHDIQAVMVTDTAFYRNKRYHTPDDTWDRLDYPRMAQVTIAVYEAICHPRTR